MTFTYRPGAGLRLRPAKGLTGTAATITAGTTTTGAEGTSAAVSNSGTTAAAVFDFTIPRGTMPAIGFNFNTATTDSDKDAGDCWFNNATPASVTVIYFDNADRNANTVSAWLDTFDDSTSSVKGTLVGTPAASPAGKLIYNVTGSVTDGTGYRKVAVTHVAGTTLPSNDAHIAWTFSRTGNDGQDGENGAVAIEGTPSANNLASWHNATTAKDSGIAASSVVTASSTTTLTNKTFDANGTGNSISNIEVSDLASAAKTGADTRVVTGTAGSNGNLAQWNSDGDAVDGPAASLVTGARQQGKETIWVPAAAMTARTTNGAASGTAEMSTNKNMVRTLDFDTTTQEFAQFEIAMPKSWNNGTVTFQPVWSHASTTTNFGVVWALQAVATSDDDALDVAFGTEQTSTDTGGTTNDRYIGPESSAITIAGSPATGDVVQFQIKRNPSDGSDTLAIDARLHGVKVFFTTNAATDA